VTAPAEIDLDGLLVALVLAPPTYSRNRFFGLYTADAPRRTRRRAALLRSVVRHLGAGAGFSAVGVAPAEQGASVLSYAVPSLGLKRTVILEPLELSVVRFALARAPDRDAAPPALRPEPEDGAMVEAALARLLPADC
jgi:hypothetical protein